MNFITSFSNMSSFRMPKSTKIRQLEKFYWMYVYESNVNTHDKYTELVKLQDTRARLYEIVGRKGVYYFTANAFCKTCKPPIN